MKRTEIESVWINEIADTPFNKKYKWCLENLGPGLEYPPRWQPIGNLEFKFRDPKDEMWFKLRWG